MSRTNESSTMTTLAEQIEASREAFAGRQRYYDEQADLAYYAGRVRITVAQFHACGALVDNEVPAYLHNKENADLGLEPWRVVEGVDPHTQGGKFDIWLASGRCIEGVDGSYEMFIAKKHFDAYVQA